MYVSPKLRKSATIFRLMFYLFTISSMVLAMPDSENEETGGKNLIKLFEKHYTYVWFSNEVNPILHLNDFFSQDHLIYTYSNRNFGKPRLRRRKNTQIMFFFSPGLLNYENDQTHYLYVTPSGQ